MTRAQRWHTARMELLGAMVLCLVAFGLEVTVDPDGWAWGLLLGGVAAALAASLAYAAVVLVQLRRDG